MTSAGGFTFVLHSHLPYARLAGRWPHGEEWLHEAAAETYIPLLNALYRLREDGLSARLTINLSPILLEQLADPLVQDNFRTYMQQRIDALLHDVERFETSQQPGFLALARRYLDEYREVMQAFDDRYGGDLIGAFRQLQQEGMIEIATCAATHGFLPLLGRDDSIELQLRTAIEAYKRHFGRPPASIWLPECAYRSSTAGENGRERAGLEAFLSRHGLTLFFAEAQMVENARLLDPDPPPRKPSFLQRAVRWIGSLLGKPKCSTFQPYLVGRSNVAVLARNQRVSLQVWSADWGFPGEFTYREFHKKDGASGMRYWRITGTGVDLGAKEIYDPALAAGKVQEHANHFYQLVLEELSTYQKKHGRQGIVSANFDTELFGHWWHEGIDWLEAVLRKFAGSEQIDLMTAGTYLARYPAEQAMELPGGSWGAGGDYSVWENEKTHWMWPIIHDAEERMAFVVAQHPSVSGIKREILNQAARELLLLQASDWPFLVTTGQANRYAVQRFLRHVERFHQLIREFHADRPSRRFLEQMWEKDKIFPEMDYRWYRP